MERPKFLSFAEATAWAMEQIENARPGEVIAEFNVETEKELVKETTKEMEYQNWLFQIGEFKKQLEVILDSAQDLWIAGEQFKSWLVKKDSQWFDVERSMNQVYSHIDSALHFLNIIKGEDK